MNPRIPNITVRKLSTAIATTLMGIAGQASAVPVSLDVIYECKFPFVGIEPIPVTVMSDMPKQVEAGVLLDAFELSANTTINENIRSGQELFFGANMEGEAIASATLITQGRNIKLPDIMLDIPNTEIPLQTGPFSLIASGVTPQITFSSQDIGPAEITVGNITLDIQTYRENGAQLSGDLGDFVVDCPMVDENENPVTEQPVFHTFEVIPPKCTNPEECQEPPKIAVAPTEIDFGAVRAGMVSEAQEITITNEGAAILGINSIDLNGLDGATEFSEVSNNCTTLEANKSCTVSYQFAPSTDGPREAKVTIDSDAPNNDEIGAITLTGEGQIEVTPVPLPSPETLDFGWLAPGASATETVTIRNSGTGTLTFGYIEVSGDDFQIANDKCSAAQLATNEQCTVDVRFLAVEDKESTGELLFTTNGGEVPVGLRGSGKGPGPGPLLQLEGETFIAASESTLPLTGSMAALIDITEGSIEADLALDPTEANFAVIKGWNSWRSTAQVEFKQTRVATGTLIDGKLKISSEMHTYVPEVTAPIFGLNVRIGGGENCRTSEPSVIELESLDGEKFSPSAGGGRVTGTYALADLENCGWLTGLINGYMAGPGNTLDLKVIPRTR